jgi:hypothetical protein
MIRVGASTRQVEGGCRALARRLPGGGLLLASLVVCGLLVMSATASAAAPAFLWRSPQNELRGSGAGQFEEAEASVADPATGDVYVADSKNSRVDEFTSYGVFVKSFGWGVADGQQRLETCGPGALPPTPTCRKGLEGSNPGQFANIVFGGMAVDGAGNVYVGDLENHRVEKFTAAGEFLLMFGGGVDKTTGADVCTKADLEAGDTCGEGSAGSGNGEFQTTTSLSSAMAYSNGSIFVGDIGRISKFSEAGAFEESINLPSPLESDLVQSLAIAPSGRLYVTTNARGETPATGLMLQVTELSAAGDVLNTIALNESPVRLAVDDSGNLFVGVEEATGGPEHREVIEFDSTGTPILAPGEGFASETGSFFRGEATNLAGLSTNVVTGSGESDLYVSSVGLSGSFVTAYGTPPTNWSPPLAPPEITAEYAESVGSSSAVVGAEINPKFWADTGYYVEFGLSACSSGACQTRLPASGEQPLDAGVVSTAVRAPGLLLTGLQAGQTYHFRFVAQSTGSGGQPVRGTGGTVGNDGGEGVFRTPSPLVANTNCPNQGFRTGPALQLADCRAYEMVSPVDKNGTDIASLFNIESNPARWDQAALEGDKLTYSTSQGFGEPSGVPYVSQYLASRTPDGWSNAGISPTQGFSQLAIGKRIDSEFRAFTPDLCSAALIHWTDPPLAAGGTEGYSTVNRRELCASESYETVSTIEPPAGLPNNGAYEPEVQGLSADGRCVVFRAQVIGIYERCEGGETRPVSLRPDGTSPGPNASVGTAYSSIGQGIRFENDLGAISSDGSTIYWTEQEQGLGPLFVRDNAFEPQSAVVGGKCTEPTKACTIRITSQLGGYWAASADGSRALVSIAGSSGASLEEFDLAKKKLTPIAGGFQGFVGAGDEAQRAFFVSSDLLTSGPNNEGNAAVAGRPNLYFYDATAPAAARFKFVGILSAGDARAVLGTSFSVVANEPFKRVSRVSEDGTSVAFLSTESLTGYQNIDTKTGEKDAEVFVYRAGDERLDCVSCNPSGQRPTGRPLIYAKTTPTTRAAAFLQPPNDLYGSRVISQDGSMVFFESYEALVPGDVNGKADVYEWEAPGASESDGACTTTAGDFVASAGGCLSLISSGESGTDSEFVDANTSGRDVFFTTGSSLVRQDPGLIDIYDARSLGGFPEAAPIVPCSGEDCQGGQQVAPQSSPQTAAQGPGNPPRKCPSGTRGVKKHGKTKCVKKKHKAKKKHKGKRAGRSRRSSSDYHKGHKSGRAGNGESK